MAKTKPIVELVQWTDTNVRGFFNPIVKIVQGVMHRCIACGAIYPTYKEAREHAIFECEKQNEYQRPTERQP